MGSQTNLAMIATLSAQAHVRGVAALAAAIATASLTPSTYRRAFSSRLCGALA